MKRTLVVITVLTLNCFNGFTQIKDLKFDRMIISHNGDSLIKQEYELNIKSNKVYFMTPFASYLHIKGEKYRRRVNYDKAKTKKIFRIVDHLAWTNLVQVNTSTNGGRFYVLQGFIADKLISTYYISEDLLPPDFISLYGNISGKSKGNP